MPVFLKAILAICLLVEIVSTTPLRQPEQIDDIKFKRYVANLNASLRPACESLQVSQISYLFSLSCHYVLWPIYCLLNNHKEGKEDVLLLNQLPWAKCANFFSLSLSKCAKKKRRGLYFFTQHKWFNRMYHFTQYSDSFLGSISVLSF